MVDYKALKEDTKGNWKSYKNAKKYVTLFAFALCFVGAAVLGVNLVNYLGIPCYMDHVQAIQKETQAGHVFWDWFTFGCSICIVLLPFIVIAVDVFAVDEKEREARDYGKAGTQEEKCLKNINFVKAAYLAFIIIVGLSFIYASVILAHSSIMLWLTPIEEPTSDGLLFFKVNFASIIFAAVGHIALLILYISNYFRVDKVCGMRDVPYSSDSALKKMWRTVNRPFDPRQGDVKFA